MKVKANGEYEDLSIHPPHENLHFDFDITSIFIVVQVTQISQPSYKLDKQWPICLAWIFPRALTYCQYIGNTLLIHKTSKFTINKFIYMTILIGSIK